MPERRIAWFDATGRGLRVRDVAGLGVLLLVGLCLARGLPTPLALVGLCLAASSALLSPAAALAATMIALPFTYHPFAIGQLAFSPLELAILMTGIGLTSRLAWAARTTQRGAAMRRLMSPLTVTLPALALLAVATFSLTTLADPAHRQESLREYRLVIVEPLIAFVAARWLLADQETRRLVAGALFAVGTLVGLVAVGQVAFQIDGVSTDGFLRARATYPHPNNLAFFLERVTLAAAGFAIVQMTARSSLPGVSRQIPSAPASVPLAAPGRTGIRVGWWPGVVALVTFAGGIATLSRGFVVAVAVGAAVIIALVGKRRWWSGYVVAVTVVVAIFGITAGHRLVDFGGGGPVPTRLLVWRASLRMAFDYPIFGVGLDQFLYQYLPRYVEPAGWPERFTSHPHNLVLDLWLRLGILGVAVFAWLTLIVGRLAVRARTSGDPTARGLAIGAGGALAAGISHGMIDNGFFLPDLALMTWFWIAIIEGTRMWNEQSVGSPRDDE